MTEQVNALHSSFRPNKPFPTLLFNGKEKKFQLDSRSTVNMMTDKTVIKLCGENGLSELDDAPVTLVVNNQSEVNPLGKRRFKVVNPKNNSKCCIEFILFVVIVNPFWA